MQSAKEALKAGAEKFLALTKPAFVNGHWRKPAVNPRMLNKLRKDAFTAGSANRYFISQILQPFR
jgi:hypothetical protein